MAKPVLFIPVNTPKGWRLSVPSKFTESGKREQRFFRTQKLAKDAADKLKTDRESFGVQAKSLSPGLSEMVSESMRRLEPYGLTILEVVKSFVKEQERIAASLTVKAAADLFRDAKKARSAQHRAALKSMSNRLEKAFPDRLMASITGEELAAHVESHTESPSAANQARALLSAFWRWAEHPRRKWCDSGVIKYIERREERKGEIGIFTESECRSILNAAETYFPECVPAIAIGLFTGIRQAEIERLSPDDVTPEGIRIQAGKSKTENGRFIKMTEPLAAWLKAYPAKGYLARRKGKPPVNLIIPKNWRRKETAVKRLAGFRVWSELVPTLKLEKPLEASPPKSLPEWKDNGLRHTSATMALALNKSLKTLIFEHGHSGGVNVLKAHYIGSMTEDHALSVWRIGPHQTCLVIGKPKWV